MRYHPLWTLAQYPAQLPDPDIYSLFPQQLHSNVLWKIEQDLLCACQAEEGVGRLPTGAASAHSKPFLGGENPGH